MMAVMPRALAIETSGQIGSVATVIDGRATGEERFPHGLQHAAQIVPIIDRLCRAAGWSARDLEELYVSVGPGSFTGLRIAVTLAKAMSLATGVKLVAVPTVRVLAENAPPGARHLVIVLDAKRDRIFTARFERERERGCDGGTWIEREPVHLDDLPSVLSRSPRPVYLLGEGIPYHQQFIPQNDPSIVVTPRESWRASASIVAAIGAELARERQFADPLTIAPSYIRRPEAEEKEEQKTSKAQE
jgi:tRNA threonylcarbamoyladenosine biosynthesis protein TsaB